MKDFTLGQFEYRDSIIHKLDPRVKIRFMMVYIIISLIDRNIPLFALLTAVFVAIVFLSNININRLFSGSPTIYAVMLLCSFLNSLTVPGEVLLDYGLGDITREGIVKSCFVFWRLVLIIQITNLLMKTTSPTSLNDGIAKAFHLKGNVSMTITIAMRFIAIIFEEMNKIKDAAISRGADFSNGNIVERIKLRAKLILPLFQNSIYKAKALGDSLDARCYDGDAKRTKLEPLKYDLYDHLVYLFTLGFILLGIYLIWKF